MQAVSISSILMAVNLLTLASETRQPEPTMTAQSVIEAQLKALQANDIPEQNHGIRVAWEYAHPANKENTGPLERFIRMLHSPAYKPLLNHEYHRVRPLKETDHAAVFEVTVRIHAGSRLKYLWVVERMDRNDADSPWRTTAVTAPVPSDDIRV